MILLLLNLLNQSFRLSIEVGDVSSVKHLVIGVTTYAKNNFKKMNRAVPGRGKQ